MSFSKKFLKGLRSRTEAIPLLNDGFLQNVVGIVIAYWANGTNEPIFHAYVYGL